MAESRRDRDDRDRMLEESRRARNVRDIVDIEKEVFPTLMDFTKYTRNKPGEPYGAAPHYSDDVMAELIRSYVKDDGADVFETDDRGNSIAMIATPGFYGGEDQGNRAVIYHLAGLLSSDDLDKLLEMKNKAGETFRDLMIKSERSDYYKDPDKFDKYIRRLKKHNREMQGGKRRRVSKKKTPKRKTSKRKTSKKKSSKRKTSKKKTSKK